MIIKKSFLTQTCGISKLFRRKLISSAPLVMSSSDCVFCKIVNGNAPADILHQDDEIIVFKDIKPASKHHYLAIPKQHIPNVNHLTQPEHKILLETLIERGKKALSDCGGDVHDVRLGFHRPPFNSVGHLHLHIISPISSAGMLSHCIFKPNTLWFQSAEATLEKLAKL